ncbi:MAG: ATP-binding protein [Thermodesulfobacteriota bacterium]
MTDHLAKKDLSTAQRRQKKRLVRLAILICVCLLPLFIWLESGLFATEITLPINSDILVFALINLNVLLVLLLLFLILRSLAELVFESKQKFMGSKLRTKLVVSFMFLALIPTGLLFFLAFQFISTSMDYWFNSNIETSLTRSLELAQSILKEHQAKAVRLGGDIGRQINSQATTKTEPDELKKQMEQILAASGPDGPVSLSLINSSPTWEVTVSKPQLQAEKLAAVPGSVLRKVRTKGVAQVISQESRAGDLVRSITPILIPGSEQPGILVTGVLVKKDQVEQMHVISQGIENYRQLKYLKNPFKFWLLTVLLIVTLLIIFSAIWFGLYIARGITGPIDTLARATRRVADGDLEFVLEKESHDEMGLLVDSFNQMTSNLNTSNTRLELARDALQLSSQEAEQRQRYTEIILQNVAAGVISMDESGRITTINRFAETLLKIDRNIFLNRIYTDVLPSPHARILDNFINELTITGKNSIEQHLKVKVIRETFSLLINFTRLEDEDHNPLGYVLVFDNLTKLEKMQRVAAWREVARRIAHEIKNPLTPIQLSAQRLRRRYPAILEEENSVFDQCTATIINQVDELKRLVSEFSQFARMPKVNQEPAELPALVEETLFLYREAHKNIDFSLTSEDKIPTFSFDAEQIKRCLINLLDNGVAVLPDGGKIDIVLSLDDEKDTVFIKVSDNGPGIPESDKPKLFEPYFSTKKSGTGLGLAIISTIVSDHSGYIRIQDNKPQGSTFVIELPLFQKQIK